MRSRFLMAAALVAGGCGGGDPVEPLELSATLAASTSSAPVGQAVTAIADVKGNFLLSLEMDWGDDDTDVSSVEGARTARWTPSHTYAAPGTYTIRLTVDEANGTITRTVSVTITAAGTR